MTPRRRHAAFASLAAVSIVLALLTVFALELANTQAKSRQDVTARVHERAVLAAALIDSLFQTTSQQIPVYARRYGARTVTSETMNANRNQNAFLVLLDSSQQVLAQSRGFTSQAQSGLAGSSALKLIGSGHPYALGDLLPYGKSGVIAFAVKFPTRYGNRILVTGFPPKALSGFIGGELDKIPGVKGARNYLIDGRRTVIASTNPAIKIGDALDSPAQIKALAQPIGTADGQHYDRVELANSTWRVVLVAPEEPLFASVSGLRKWLPWMIFAGFSLFAIVALLLGRRVLRGADQVREANAQLESVNAELATSNASLERRAAELARSNEELDQFASIASHDLQEPLRKVRTFTQQVTVMEGENLSEKSRDYLGRANAAAERMQQLIEDLLKFSRVATNARPFAVVDLGVIARDVLGDLETEVERSGAIVRVGELPAIHGDALQMRQLIQNLLSNSLKFRREDAPPEIDLEATVVGDTATVILRDNGIGFDPQYSRRIFRVFERLHGRGKYPGTGIGLALCRKIVERHAGTITADGVPGVGSTFTITLPVDQREAMIAPGSPSDDGAIDVREKERVHA